MNKRADFWVGFKKINLWDYVQPGRLLAAQNQFYVNHTNNLKLIKIII